MPNTLNHVGNELKRFPFTSLMLIVNVLIFLLMNLGAGPFFYHLLQFADPQQLATSMQWWRLFSPALMHFSAMHIVFNVLWWWLFGKEVEQRFGSVGIALLFLFVALCSNLAQFYLSGPNFGGMSGVVYGLLGFIWVCSLLKPQWGLTVQTNLLVFMLLWLVLGFTGLTGLNIANMAHLMGLLSGIILALIFISLSRLQRGEQRV